jgi:hypothetical protein
MGDWWTSDLIFPASTLVWRPSRTAYESDATIA